MERIKLSQIFTCSADTEFPLANVEALDFSKIALKIIASDTASFSVRVKVSDQVGTPPDFTAPASATNSWTFVQTVNTLDGSTYPGDVGFVITADGTYHLELNQDIQAWVAVEVFNYVSGDFEGQFIFKNNV